LGDAKAIMGVRGELHIFTVPKNGVRQARCQSAADRDPLSASKGDPFERRVRAVALAPSELVGVAETARARVVG
jgi:hypothetical protein